MFRKGKRGAMKLYQWDPVSGETTIGERVGGERDNERRGVRNVRGEWWLWWLGQRSGGYGSSCCKGWTRGISFLPPGGHPKKKSIQTKHRNTFWHIVMCYSFWLLCPPVKLLVYVNRIRHFSRLKSMCSKDPSHTRTHTDTCVYAAFCERTPACFSVGNCFS